MERPQLESQDGFTLVEVVVTLSVIAFGLFGLMSVFLGSLRAGQSSDARTSANSIATGELEGMRAVPFDDLGFEATAAGYSSTWLDRGVTHETVTVGAGRAQVTPDGTDQTRKGEVFTVRRQIVWVAATNSGDATRNDFKRVVVTVTWADVAGTHVVRQDSAVYPGGRPSGSTTTTTSAPLSLVQPSCTSVTQNPSNPQTALDLTWTRNGATDPTTWEIRRRNPNDGVSVAVIVTSSLPGGQRSFTDTTLGSGNSYDYEIRGLTGTGSGDSSWATCPRASTQAAATCQVVSSSVTASSGNIALRKNGGSGKLQHDVIITVNTTGPCTTLRVRFTPDESTPSPVTLTNTSGTHRTTLGSDTYGWSKSNKTIDVLNSSGVVIAQISLRVCNELSCA